MYPLSGFFFFLKILVWKELMLVEIKMSRAEVGEGGRF